MNPRRFVLFLLLTIASSGGCAKVSHLDQLLVLKHLSEDQANTGKDVDKKNNDFDMLVAMVQSGDISRYKDQKSIVAHFGAPILTRQRIEGEQKIEEWIYRYQTKFFNSPKVYLHFDESGALIKSFVTDVKPTT